MTPQTVLIIDDHTDNREIYSTILGYRGFQVIEAGDGAEGLELARRHQPDLILMDISLPVLDGWTATSILKQSPDTADIPVVALTAHALPEDRARADAIGFDGFLAKPCGIHRMIEEVERFLPDAARPAPAGDAVAPLTPVIGDVS